MIDISGLRVQPLDQERRGAGCEIPGLCGYRRGAGCSGSAFNRFNRDLLFSWSATGLAILVARKGIWIYKHQQSPIDDFWRFKLTCFESHRTIQNDVFLIFRLQVLEFGEMQDGFPMKMPVYSGKKVEARVLEYLPDLDRLYLTMRTYCFGCRKSFGIPIYFHLYWVPIR